MPKVTICDGQFQELLDAIGASTAPDYTQILTDILTAVQAVDANTDQIEEILTEQLTDVNASLVSILECLDKVKALLDQVNENTDEIEELINTQTQLLQSEFDETQEILNQLLKKPTFREVCFADGCSGYATYSIAEDGTMAPLKAYGEDGVERPTSDIAPCCPCGDTVTVENAFAIEPGFQTENTKYNLDDPGFTNAYADVGTANWTAADLAASLNANAAGAPAPYTTTVWGSGTSASGVDYVNVVSGPVPSSLDLISIPVSIPVSSI